MDITKMDVMQVLKNDGGRVIVSSLDVARFFEKEHNHVMRDIRNLLELKPELGLSTFGQSSYTNSQNKVQPCYLMDRKGFTLLAMGFTGEKALHFKDAFYNAFEEMEARLKEPNIIPQASREGEIIAGGYAFMQLFKIPEHIAAIELAKEVKRQTGTDYSSMLISSPIMDNIDDNAAMLEPTPLGKKFKEELSLLGFNDKNMGKNLNNFLISIGAQDRQANGDLIPNPSFQQYYSSHQWQTKGGIKTGYNYKWNVNWVKNQLDSKIKSNNHS